MTRGAVLIVTTWILAILILFALGVGFRTGIEIKLTGYSLDELKAIYIARAGIKRGIIEKWEEYHEGRSLGIDAFSEQWANDEKLFKDAAVGEGKFTMSYLSGELDRGGREVTLYGLEDETRKININSKKALSVLRDLLMGFDMDLVRADEIISAIEDWRDEDDIPKAAGDVASSAEDIYYQSLDIPYFAGNRDFAALEELLLVRGISKELFYDKLARHITIYGEGRININTAAEEILNAVFGIGYPELASKIINYRKGIDGRVGTDDDRWFVIGEYVIDRGRKGMVEFKNLNDADWYGNIFGVDNREFKRLKELSAAKGLISASSDHYRASVLATANKVRKRVAAVIKFNPPPPVRGEGFGEGMGSPDIEWLYWHEER